MDILKTNFVQTAIQSHKLLHLAEQCREAGAITFSLIPLVGKSVLFYKNPYSLRDSNTVEFDEVHIQSQNRVFILIVVFNDEIGYESLQK